jgi:hypothetical protein
MEEAAFLSPARFAIFIGAFGSGKTEVAVNYALACLAAGRPAAIVDLDVVNPYLRVGELRPRLERAGLQVIAPGDELSRFDTPALSPEIVGLFQEETRWAVLDVGGDAAGTRALGQYAPTLQRLGPELWLVINARRPDTRTPADMVETARALERQARLKLTGLINNTNLLEETTAETVRSGHRLVVAAAAELGLPVTFAAAPEALAPDLPDLGSPLLPLRRHLFSPWEG